MKPAQRRSFFEEPVVEAFIAAAGKTLSAYIGAAPVVGTPLMSRNLAIPSDVAGIVDFRSHEVEGAMVIAFEKKRALALYHQLLGEEPTELNDEVQDCIAELANTIYGAAKAPLVDAGYEFPMARPTVTLNVGAVFQSGTSLALPLRLQDEPGIALVLVVRRLVAAA